VARSKPKQLLQATKLKGQNKQRFDRAGVLAALEKQDPKLANVRDEEIQVADSPEGGLQMHIENTEVPGVYHLGVYVEGTYCPGHSFPQDGHSHDHGHNHGTHSTDTSTCDSDCSLQSFSRVLSVTTAVVKEQHSKSTRNMATFVKEDSKSTKKMKKRRR
jgi:hypothetical protein